MVLEATIICLDNSEWMRNGDYFPSRMEAQIDAINVVMGWKFQSNPENTVGILKMGKGPEVLVTPGPDIGKVLSALHSVKIQGKIDIMTSIQVAQLALKHRQNKNQHQRMILFIGSPAQADTAALTKLGQALKKNNVAVDVISFGEVEENREKLEAFVKAVNSNDNSHLVEVETGTRTLTEAVRASPLSGRAAAAGGGGGGEGAAAGGGGEGGEDFFGIDPNEDPELAMAIRASLEEEKRRREREDKEKGGAEGAEGAAPTQETVMTDAGDEDEEAMLAEAIALSMQAQASQPTDSAPESAAQPETKQEIAASTPAAPASEKAAADAGEITDPQFLNDILASLPGVDPNDPQIQLILESMKAQQQGEKKEGEK
jgi:26S proteasome regulatory subunit N10